MKLLAVFFAAYLLLNTGFIQQLANEPWSPALSPSLIDSRPHFSESEIVAAAWLGSSKSSNLNVSADFFNAHLTLMSFGSWSPLQEYTDTSNHTHVVLPEEGYFFFGGDNVQKGTFTVTFFNVNYRVNYDILSLQGSELNDTLATHNLIYDSGDARVFQI